MLRQTNAMNRYITITFGPRNDGPSQFYNERTWWDRQSQAEKWGLQSLSIAGCFGYVVIEDGEDSWRIVDECGAPSNAVSVSAEYKGGVTYSVQPAPKFQLV
jgi:hypothetical protein